MTINKRKTMESWIKEALSDPDKDGKCQMMSLVHMVGQQQKEIHTTKFDGKTWPDAEIAAMFKGKADTYSQDIPGVQMFQLLAFYGGRTAPEAFFPFVVNGNNEYGGLATEAPNEQGKTQQDMRWKEMHLSQVYRRQQVMDDFAIRVMEMQTRQIEVLTRENRDAFTIVKDMLMEKALNDHNRTMTQLQYERSTSERKKWLGWAPALVNTVLGREIFPQSTADTALIESLTESLTEEDIMKIASTLKPEVMGPLAARMHIYMEKKNKEEANIKAMRQLTSPDPESDAAGDIVRVNNGSS